MKAQNVRDEIVLHIPAMRAFAVSLTRKADTADDLVQDTIERAWKNIESFRQGSNLRAWLFTILRNCYFSGLRKYWREVPDTDGSYAARLVAKAAHDEALAFRDFLVAFARLSAEHRETLTLVGATGFSYDEAAQILQVAVGTVKSRASRARAILMAHLGLSVGESLLSDIGFAMPALATHAPAHAM